ncbi:MAG: penicillin-binding protein 2 [Myxococcota bacterium]|nr:penicillin-binding protein 2 [Myxococcota bacterium]
MSQLSGGLSGGSEPFFEQRLGVLALGVAAAFAVFLFRLVQLQLVQGDEHLERSQRNSIRTVRLAAPRGEIEDREGRVLATTRPAFHLEAIPSEVQHAERSSALLVQLLGDRDAELAERVSGRRGRARFQPVRLFEDLSWEQLARVESHRYALPGFFTEVLPRRHYPQGSIAAHSLGTIGEIRAEQLEARRVSGYRAGEQIGQSGIEALLESHLRGRMGGRNVVVDVKGREVEVLDRVEPRPGGRVRLALDLDLQQVAEAAFEPREDGEPRTGSVVALDPRDGDVLVLVSAPSFDPNDFPGGVDAPTWRSLTQDALRPLQNRAIAGQYPPGSTYKPIVAAAALQEGVIGAGTRVFCPGSFKLGRRTYRCWRKEGHGEVDLHDALMKSCDVFFYRTGLQLGIDRLATYAEAFGLGRPTRLAIGGEQPGLVPTRAWKERRFDEPWVRGETVSAAIGQGYNLVTPLQLAVAYAALVNGGAVLRPRLVRELHHLDGSVTREPIEVLGRIEIDPAHIERVRGGLEAVVHAPGGTGRRAQVAGLQVGGKTGTAQVVRLERVEGLEDDEIPRRYRDHAWFAAFAPAEEPEIVVVVLLEHGRGGGANAAPIAQQVLERWWQKRNALPADAALRQAALEPAEAAP